jgi:phage repressor protein C with HTH and peptisase S24 domain
MTALATRLRELRKAKGLSQQQLALKLGWGQSRIGNYESEGKSNREPSIEDLHAIAAALNVSIDQILETTGPGAATMREPPKGYLRPISTWDRPEDLPEGQFGFLQHLDAYLSAGNGGPSVEAVERTDKSTPFRSDWLRSQGWNPHTHFTMRCKGDSMEPTIQDGAPVVIDTSDAGRRVQTGRIYALSIDGELLLKRLDKLPGGVLRVRSDNSAPMYAPFELSEAAVAIIGRAVWTPVSL